MISKQDNVLENLLTKFQKYTALALAAMLAVVVMLSTVHLGSLIARNRVSSFRCRAFSKFSDTSCWC